MPAPGPGEFAGGPLTAPSVYDALEVVGTAADTTVQTESDSLTAGGDDHGPYTWARQTGPLVLDSEEAWDALLGAGHDDLRPALVYVEGDVTVSHDPARRRPFVALECTGALTLSSDINGLGANHSASGSDKASTRILWALGTYDGVTDPQVPATGGDGAAGVVGDVTGAEGAAGAAGVGGATGGGGSGAAGSSSTSGAGAAGTSYSGGAGGGGAVGNGSAAGAGGERGGAGGNGDASGSANGGASGGAGNPGGAASARGSGTADQGSSRTGGAWYIRVGSIAGSGSLVCDGGDGGESSARGGAASGGGHGLAQTDDVSQWGGGVTANGGAGGSGVAAGGNGGLGFAAVLPATEDAP